MTATAAPPRRPAASADPDADLGRPAARRTALALLASALGVLPLKGLFTDWGWLADVWVTMAIALGPAIWLRRRRPAGALDIWPGIVLLAPWLTLRFVPQHAIAGLIPGSRTASDVSHLLSDLHDTTANSVAPIHSTLAVKLVLCALLGLLAALIDLIAVVGHRGALAGVPLLIVYTVSGAVPRHPVSWVWFVFSALGFLLLLGLDSGEELERWGRRFRTARRPASTARWSVSTPRIVVSVLVLAVLAPLVVPGQSRNLIANAFHGGGGGNGIGTFGGGSSGTINPFAVLKGQLDQPTPYPMADVHISGDNTSQPFYLRVNVLDKYTSDGWRVGDHGDEVAVEQGDFGTEPTNGGAENSVALQARITVTGLTGNAPVFAVPTAVSGLGGATWSPQDQILLGDPVSKGQTYVEDFRQPAPTPNQLTSASRASGAELAADLQLPSNFPAYAHALVQRLTSGISSPYQQARAVNDYFTDARNGFVYDLKTKQGDSGSALVDFLQNKHGFCQQYAAAMAVMLRDARIPSRVVLGYMHDPTDVNGDFSITSAEAHSWVEAYFTGIGWIPFDPTPSTGLVGGTRTDLPWAPHSYATGSTNDTVPKTRQNGQTPSTAPTGASSPAVSTAPGARAASSSGSLSLTALWWALGVLGVVVLGLLPAAVRAGRRRRRFAQARRDGNADALWAELSDTAVDLGYVWSPARSPRQVAGWLGRDASATRASLQELAAAVERGRYSGPDSRVGDVATLERGLKDVAGDLRAGRSLGTRLRSVFWPASLKLGSIWRAPLLRGRGRRRN